MLTAQERVDALSCAEKLYDNFKFIPNQYRKREVIYDMHAIYNNDVFYTIILN